MAQNEELHREIQATASNSKKQQAVASSIGTHLAKAVVRSTNVAAKRRPDCTYIIFFEVSTVEQQSWSCCGGQW